MQGTQPRFTRLTESTPDVYRCFFVMEENDERIADETEAADCKNNSSFLLKDEGELREG